LPSVQELHEELADRDDVAILALNSGVDDDEVVERYWEDSGFSFPAVMDVPGEEGANARSLKAKVFPTNIVVGPDGRVLYASVGYDEARIRELLGL